MAGPWEKYDRRAKPEPEAGPWSAYQGINDTTGPSGPEGNPWQNAAAAMDPIDLSIARSKNDEFGQYLRNQAMQPKTGEDATARNKRLYGSIPNTETDPGKIEGMTRGFLQGGVLGFGDELVAAGAAGVDAMRGDKFGESYDTRLATERSRMDRFKDTNPVLAYGSEIVGAIASPVMAAAGPMMTAPQGAGMAARMGRSALGGAALGGAYGAGAAEGDLTSRAKGAGSGAAFVGAIGAVMPPAVNMVSALGRGAYNQIAGRMPFQQETVARRKIAEALAREGITPQQATARMQEIGPQAALMDVGNNPRSLARAAATVPGEGKAALTNFLTARQEGVRNPVTKVAQGGQSRRITSMVDALVPDNYHATKEGLSTSGAASDFYRTAYKANQSVASNEVDKILETPAGRQALKEAARMMQNDRTLLAKPDPEMTAALREAAELGKADYVPGGVGSGLKLRTLDYVKRAFGDMEKAAIRAGRDDEARIIGDLRRGFTSELDIADITARAGPNSFKPEGGAYAQARKLSADRFAKQDALESGANFMMRSEFTDPQALKAAVAKMGPEEQHMFRVGAAQAIKSKLEGLVTRADATKKIMDIPALEDKIRTAFGSDDLFRKYIASLEGERAMFDSYSKILGGSRTGEVIAEQADAAIDPSRVIQGLRRMASSNPIDWVAGGAQALGGAKDRLMMPEGTSQNLAKILMGQDVTPLQQAYQAVGMSDARRQAIARALTAAGASRQGQ